MARAKKQVSPVVVVIAIVVVLAVIGVIFKFTLFPATPTMPVAQEDIIRTQSGGGALAIPKGFPLGGPPPP